jgi:hypothetical protein
MSLSPSEGAAAVVDTAKSAAILNHIKQNNVSYLLGILIGHMLGLTDMVFEYGQGMC